MMYQDVVRSRRSVRDFMPDVEIPKEELMAIIEEAMSAPNSTNLNSWRFLIVTEKRTKKRPFTKFRCNNQQLKGQRR